MSNKGIKYIAYSDGNTYDEFGNEYKYDEPYLFDSEGKKHEIKENDLIGFYAECSTPNENVVFQKFSLSFDVNVSASVVRASNHHGHILPLVHSASGNKPMPEDFIDFIESEFGESVIIAEEGKICPEVRYEVTPCIEVKIKSNEKNLQPIRKTEEELKLTHLDEDKNIEKFEKLFAEMALFLEKELKGELHKITAHLQHEFHVKDKDKEIRKIFIAEMLRIKDKDVRRRIPTQKGRTPINQQKDFLTEKQRFINQCFDAFDELKEKKRKLNRTELAEILFNDSNPLQTLRRRFKSLELTFQDVLLQYNEQKFS